jgi:hypothetical protein
VRRTSFAVYNTGPVGENPPPALHRQLNAIGNNRPHVRGRRRPKGIHLMETIGRDMPTLDHYHPPIHDRSDPAHANLCMYVLARLERGNRRFIDLDSEWWRPRDPDTRHPNRALLLQDVEDWTWVLSHAPEKPRDHFHDHVNRSLVVAREEWVKAIVSVARGSRRPTMLFTDPNGLGPEIRKRAPAYAFIGDAGQGAHAGRAVFTAMAMPGWVNGVKMDSDHGVALLGRAVRRRAA